MADREDLVSEHDRVTLPEDIALAERQSGIAAHEAGRYDDAISHFSRAIEQNPFDPLLFSNRAAAFLKLHRYNESLADCDKTLELRPDHPLALLRKAESCFHLGHWPEAVELLQRWLQCDESVPDHPARRDTVWFLECLQEVMSSQPSDLSQEDAVLLRSAGKTRADVEKRCGNLMYAHKDFQKAIEQYKHACALDPENAVINCNLAAAHLGLAETSAGQDRLQHLKNAIRRSSKSIQIDPTYAKAYMRRGRAAYLLQHFLQAVNDLRRACELAPDGGIAAQLQTAQQHLQQRNRDVIKTHSTQQMPSKRSVQLAAQRDEISKWLRSEDAQRILKDIATNPQCVVDYAKGPHKDMLEALLLAVEPQMSRQWEVETALLN